MDDYLASQTTNSEITSKALTLNLIKKTFLGDGNFSTFIWQGELQCKQLSCKGRADFREARFGGLTYFSLVVCCEALVLSGVEASNLEFEGLSAKKVVVLSPKSLLIFERCSLLECEVQTSNDYPIRFIKNSNQWDKEKAEQRLQTLEERIDKKKKLDRLYNNFLKKQKIKSISFANRNSYKSSRLFRKRKELKKDKIKGLILFDFRKSVRQNNTKIHSFFDSKIKKILKEQSKSYWDFDAKDLSNLTFIECDLSRIIFDSAVLGNVFFDNCKWSNDNKEKYDSLYQHQQRLEGFKKEQSKANRESLNKLKNVYQRLKKHFEENHDYRQAGHFHYREKEIQSYTDKRLDRTALKIYKWIGDFGESYFKLLSSLFIFMVAFPVFPVLISLFSVFNNNNNASS